MVEVGNLIWKSKIRKCNSLQLFPDGSYGGNPGGFVIESGTENIYIAVRWHLTMDMKLIPMRTKLDFSHFNNRR
jgi:hypothetical protein